MTNKELAELMYPNVKLTIEDLDPNPKEYKLDVIEDNYKILYSNYHTNDIAYVRYVFDITNMTTKDLKTLSLFSTLWYRGKVPVKYASWFNNVHSRG